MSRDLPPNYFMQDDRAPARGRRNLSPASRNYKVRSIKVGGEWTIIGGMLSTYTKEGFAATRERRVTAREMKMLAREGELHPEAELYAVPLPELDWIDRGDSWYERLMRTFGMQLAEADVRVANFGEFAASTTVSTVVLGAAATGAAAAMRQQGAIGPQDAVAAIERTVEDLGVQLLTPNSEPPAIQQPAANDGAEDYEAVNAAIAAARVVSYFRYNASTRQDLRISTENLVQDGAVAAEAQGLLVSTNDAYTVLGGTFTATNILHELGLLRANGVLINMPENQLAGELTGKSQLESGLSPTIAATHGGTLDSALGAFQIKPSTAFALLAMRGHDIDDVPGLVDPQLRQIIERGMRNLADSPKLNDASFRQRHNIREDNISNARSIARNYNYDEPGRAASNSNLFYAAFETLSDADKLAVRAHLVDTENQVARGNFSGARGVVLSGVIAGMLSDQLNVSQELVDRYGFRAFGYIGHQAGPRAVALIAGRLERRDQYQEGTAEWNRADFQLRRSILNAVRIRSNYPVYTTARAPRTFTEVDILPWSGLQSRGANAPNIVDGISEKFGVDAGLDLPRAASDLYAAIDSGAVSMDRAEYSGRGTYSSIAITASPSRTSIAIGEPARDPRRVRAPTG